MTRRKGMHWYCILQYLLPDASGTSGGQFMSTFVGYDTNDIAAKLNYRLCSHVVC